MLGWLKTVLTRDNAPRVGLHLAAFGKHPGWDDHLDSQGMDTDRLVEFKRRLYVEGIGANIDAGTWAADPELTEASPLKHLIIWHDGASVILARMWPSVDGKGRSSFPMIVCIEAIGIDVQWAISTCLPVLERLEGKCREATTADQVIEVLDDARQDLVRVSTGILPIRVLDASDRSEALIEITGKIETDLGRSSVHRLMHRLVGMLGEPEAESSSGSPPSERAQHVRVPRAANQPHDAAWAWLRALGGWGARPVMVIMPLRHKYIDLVIGPPGRGEFACLRTPESTNPLVTTIEYSIDEASAARFDQMLKPIPRPTDRSA